MDFVRSQEVGFLLHPPKSDDRYAQLTRGGFIINDFLRNPHFKKRPSLSSIISNVRLFCSNIRFRFMSNRFTFLEIFRPVCLIDKDISGMTLN